jgi:hypothetical protein
MNLLEPLASIAASQIGIHEEGSSNAGSDILKYQQATELAGQGWPWCCAFVDWCIREFLNENPALASITLETRPKTASVFEFRDWAESTGQLVFSPSQVGTYNLQAGDIVVFSFSHIGIVAGPAQGSQFPTIEGNTNVAGSRDGGEVAAKTRNFSSVDSFIRLAVRGQAVEPTSPS